MEDNSPAYEFTNEDPN